MKRAIWIILIFVVLPAAIYTGIQMNKGEESTEVTIEKAEKGDITSVVTATGKVHPEIEVKISSEVAGEIIQLPVKDGQHVTKGDLLFVVNPDRLEAKVLQQEAALRGNHANEAASKARMLQAQLDLQRIQGLFEKGYATQEQIDEAKTQYEINKANHQATLFRIQEQEMSLKEAKDSLSKASTYAPMSGTITSLSAELGDRVVGTGQFAGTEILRIANLSQIEIRVDVSESDIVSITTGDSASIEIDAIPDTVFEATVTEIANSANSQGSSQDQITSFQVKARLTSPTANIRPGMSATAEIKTQTATDIIKVPIQSVTVRSQSDIPQNDEKKDKKPKDAKKDTDVAKGEKKERDPREGGKRSGNREGGKSKNNLQRVVFKYKDGKVTLVPVETGISDNKSIEIKSGVEEGESVVTGSYRVLTRQLKDAMEVSIAEKNSDKKGKGKK